MNDEASTQVECSKSGLNAPWTVAFFVTGVVFSTGVAWSELLALKEDVRAATLNRYTSADAAADKEVLTSTLNLQRALTASRIRELEVMVRANCLAVSNLQTAAGLNVSVACHERYRSNDR